MSKTKVADAAAKEVEMSESTASSNTVDGAIVSLAQLEWSMGWNSKLGFIVPILLHIASQVIQFVVLYFFYVYSLEALEDKFENAQFKMISTSIDTAIATKTPLSKLTKLTIGSTQSPLYPAGSSNMGFYKKVHGMCEQDISGLSINALALFLFMGSVFNDIHDIMGKLYIMATISSDGDGEHSTDENDEIDITKPGAKNLISTMAVPYKIVAVVFILLPHVVCHLCIAFAGSKLISLGTAPFTVVKAFLKIYFISKFDVELFKSFSSEKFLAYMKVTKFATPKPRTNGVVEVMGSAAITFIKVALAFLWAYLCLFHIFPNLNEYRSQCAAYYTEFKATGYGHVIDHNKCIFGNAINPATNLHYTETCGDFSLWN